MTEQNLPMEHNVKKKQKKNPIKSSTKLKSKYNEETSYRSSDPETRDATTEARVEIDNVYVTAEIYSMTDIPSSLKNNKNAKPKPGMIVPEYCDEKCLVLRAYRDKTVNTDGPYDFSEPCLSLKCLFPPTNFAEKLACYRKEVEKFCEPSMESCVRIKWSMCKDTCPNLITSETSQIKEDCSVKPADQTSSERTSVKEPTNSFVKDAAVSTTNETKGKRKPGAPMSLMPIHEQKEERKTEAKKKLEDPRTNNGKITKGMGEEFVKEPDTDTEDTGDNTEDEFADESDTDQVNKLKPVKELKTTNSQKIEDAAVDASTTSIAAESSFSKQEIIPSSPNRDKVFRKTPIKSSACKFEMGTIITSQSACWLDRPRRRFSASRENFCCDSRANDCFVRCTKFVDHSTVQCEIITDDARSNCSPIARPISCRYLQHRESCARRFDNSGGSNEISTMDYWPSKSDPFQETFIRRSFHGINNGQGCSIAREPLENRNNAYNQNYVNSNKGYYNGMGGYCLCNNGYNNARYANTFYCRPRNQMVYHTPIHCYHFCNAWY